ncbi:MAG: hypothetical protein K1X74_12870 [Pirellulales bacterium]|nr:hypothetical protein [Pirellulales bacterium]
MKPSNSQPAALLVIGHGTREAAGVAEFAALVEQISVARPGWIVEPGFLEFAEPSIAAAVDRAVERGAKRLLALPLVLFAAGHAKRDIPEALKLAAAEHPGLEIVQRQHLGCHPRLLELSAVRFEQAMCDAPRGVAETLVLFVGRGSHDPEANAEMAQFARLRHERTPTARYALAFTAMAEPRVDTALESVARLGFPQVIVQPHLLFQGQLLSRLAAQVAQASQQFPAIHWRLATHLGPDQLLAMAALEIADACREDLPVAENLSSAESPRV